MKIRVSILIICLLLLFNPITYAVKVVFKAKPISTNLIEGPYAVFVYYKIYDDDTEMSNIEGFIDMPLLKKKDIRNIVVKKSDKLIIGQKPKFNIIKEGEKLGNDVCKSLLEYEKILKE